MVLEEYYFSRYMRISNILRNKYLTSDMSSFAHKIQSKFFKSVNFYKPRDYFNKYNNYEEFAPQICFDYQEWKAIFVVPYLYACCDDYVFIKKIFDRAQNPLLRYIQKFRTIIEEKRRWRIDPIDFVMFENDFYEDIIDKFYTGEKFVGKYDAFVQFLKSRRFVDPIFAPISDIPKFVLSDADQWKTMRANIYKFQEYCYNLAIMDDKYFNDFFNITLFGNFTYPQMVTTRINFELMDEMFNAFDPEQYVESVPYLPSKFATTDETNPYYMHVAVQTYWKETFKHISKLSTSKVTLYEMAFLPEWKLSTLPVFLCIVCVFQTAFLFNFDDVLYSHKQPFQLESTLSTILIFFIKVLNFTHFIVYSQYMDLWYQMPDYAPFITLEDFEFVFQGSNTAIWNYYYSTHSATSQEWKWLVSTRMYQVAYGAQTDPYFLLKDWLEFEHREVFEGTKNLRWRDFADNTGTVEMFPVNLNMLASIMIRLWCHMYYWVTLPFSEVTLYPYFVLFTFFPCYILIYLPMAFIVQYMGVTNKFRWDNFYLNYVNKVKTDEYVNKK